MTFFFKKKFEILHLPLKTVSLQFLQHKVVPNKRLYMFLYLKHGEDLVYSFQRYSLRISPAAYPSSSPYSDSTIRTMQSKVQNIASIHWNIKYWTRPKVPSKYKGYSLILSVSSLLYPFLHFRQYIKLNKNIYIYIYIIWGYDKYISVKILRKKTSLVLWVFNI